MEHQWRFLPQIMVRVAGFPVDLLGALEATGTVDAFERLDEVERVLVRQRDEVVIPELRASVSVTRGADDRTLRRALSQARRAITADRAAPDQALAVLPPNVRTACERWNTLLASRETLVREARSRFAEELPRCREALRSLVAREDVLDALLLSSPSMRTAAARYVAAVPPTPRTSVVRKLERRLAAYLQRFCAKNETQSFFGPVNYGRLDDSRADSVTVVRTGAGPRRRESFPAQWMAQQLAALVARDAAVGPWLRPRRGTWTGRAELVSGGVADEDLRLYDLADGSLRVAELAHRLAEPWPDTWDRVRRLSAAGGLVTGPVIPPDQPDPLAWLIGWLSDVDETGLADRWLPVLHALRDRVLSFAAAPLDKRDRILAALSDEFTAVCGGAAERSGGEMYADRSLLFEECLGDLAECTVGGSLYREITQRLAPVLRLARWYGILERCRDGRAAAALLSTLDGGPVSLPRYVTALAAHRRGPDVPDELDDLLRSLDELVARRTDGRVVRLLGAELPAAGGGTEPDECTFTSLDLMVRARSLTDLQAGRYQLVIGEIHPQPLLWVFPSAHFLDEDARAELAAALHEGLSAQPGAAVAAQFVHTRSNKIFPYELPGRRIELRPRRSTVDSLPAAEVEVRSRGDGVCCWAADGGWLRVYPPLRRRENGLDPVAPLAFPAVHLPVIGSGDRIPRIEVDGIVVQRERWHLTRGEFALTAMDDFDLFHAAWRAHTALGLPRQVYVRVPQEKKPVFVDFANVFLVELLARLGRAGPTMTVTEALPATDETWLDGPGGRYTVELRLVVLGERH